LRGLKSLSEKNRKKNQKPGITEIGRLMGTKKHYDIGLGIGSNKLFDYA
jgi:hypothetical protein